jgi:L-alanine-DL-glutamate epimerase-like enolase superfamily enzyme
MNKIREIRAAGLYGTTRESGWDSDLVAKQSIYTLIAVHTDDGLTGIGSVYTNDHLVKAALKVLEPLFMGENALEPERVSEKLHQNTFWLGRGGSITHTISGIDIALWDILGQATGQPVGRLLGGRYRERVKPYASVIMQEPQGMVERLQPLMERGWRAFKIGWGPFGRTPDKLNGGKLNGAKLDEAIVRAARETVGDAHLMVDAGASGDFWPHGYKWALRTAEMLADYEVDWFEEALAPDALDDYIELRRRAPLPIAGGEVLTRRQSFQPWLQRGALDIVQPDTTKVGGLSEARRIGWMAQEAGIKLIPHGWNTAVGLAADLQLASALATTDFVEYIEGSPFVDALVATPWTLDDEGMLAIPAGPGLGVEWNWEAVERFARAERLMG